VETSEACTFCGTCTDFCMADARRLAGRPYTLDELICEVEKDTIFFDESGGGVTLSGGEPLAQAPFAAAFLDACRERGIATTLETCGFVQPAVFEDAAPRAGLIFFDLKAIDPETHRRYTGVPNGMILRNLEWLVARSAPVTVRIPVIPGVNDSAKEIDGFANYLNRLCPPAVELLPYHRTGMEKYRRLGLTYELADTPEPALGELEHFRDALARAGVNAWIRV